jgi:integrase
VRALLEGCPPRLRVMVALALCLALRKGEILGLRVEDLDLVHLVLHVRHSHNRPAPKNGRWRDLPIPSALEPHLRAWLADVAGDVVFPGGSHGGLLNKDFPLPELVRAELVRLGVRSEESAAEICFHTLRHTWSTLAEAAGVPDKLRSYVMGHAPTVTEGYTHRSMDRLRQELEKVHPTQPEKDESR